MLPGKLPGKTMIRRNLTVIAIATWIPCCNQLYRLRLRTLKVSLERQCTRSANIVHRPAIGSPRQRVGSHRGPGRYPQGIPTKLSTQNNLVFAETRGSRKKVFPGDQSFVFPRDPSLFSSRPRKNNTVNVHREDRAGEQQGGLEIHESGLDATPQQTRAVATAPRAIGRD